MHAFVISRLLYCNGILAGCLNNSIKMLQLIQNAAARVLTGTAKRDHISPVLASLHWLPVMFRIQFKILLMTHKALNSKALSYSKDLVFPYQPHRCQSAGLQTAPRVYNSSMGGRAFNF